MKLKILQKNNFLYCLIFILNLKFAYFILFFFQITFIPSAFIKCIITNNYNLNKFINLFDLFTKRY